MLGFLGWILFGFLEYWLLCLGFGGVLCLFWIMLCGIEYSDWSVMFFLFILVLYGFEYKDCIVMWLLFILVVWFIGCFFSMMGELDGMGCGFCKE